MLQIKNIKKQFVTGDLTQVALNDVSLNLRDNEFVAILGPSGSGKTTLLNVIGGLDRYDSGDLIINGISTKDYKDRDWDSYRNHTIGFVFQSYNLIPHQSILANVELALTISGISRKERRKRAREALETVGLGDQLHKKPSQMSGGQMQRDAIARALNNYTENLMADEPTGALDTETSLQVMDLLKEVATDRLVVMVTHNPELAEEYANRIVKLRDGKITEDSNPFEIDETATQPPKHKNMGKASMSFFTALSLSFNNLRTKKGRTLLTSFAGSIGIIGIALILSLSNGVKTYIDDIQKSTMSSYPITLEATTMDMTAFMESSMKTMEKLEGDIDHKLDGVYSNTSTIEMASSMTGSITENNLTDFKKYLDNKNSEIHKYIGENGIVYSYNTKFSVLTKDSEGVLVNTDGSTLEGGKASAMTNMMSMGPSTGMSSMMSAMKSNNFTEIMPGPKGESIGKAITDNYSCIYGDWPKNYNDVVLVLDKNNEINAADLYQLGILPSSEYRELMAKIEAGEEVAPKAQKWNYADICKKEFYLVPECDLFEKQENGLFASVKNDNKLMENKMKKGIKLNICGVIKPNEDTETVFINQPVGYTKALTDYLIAYTEKSEVVKAQRANKIRSVLNGRSFIPKDEAAKLIDTEKYISYLGVSDKAKLYKAMAQAAGEDAAAAIIGMDEATLAAAMDMYMRNPDKEFLLGIYENYISPGSFEDNLTSFGVVSYDAPATINIYADSFENKDLISASIDNYNKDVAEENKITFTDYVGLLMSSITTIIDVITYVLVAFVSVSLVVSSIMIGIITYISVLERTKEIGILRAIGASKRNISQVFNAETFIIGLCSGIIGVGITLLLLIPINAIIHYFAGIDTVNAALPILVSGILVALSMLLTLFGGIIPSRKAAKKDPVTALRTE